MRTDALHVGDVVEVDLRGWIVPAQLSARPSAETHNRWQFTPLIASCGYRSCTSRQIKRLLRKGSDTTSEIFGDADPVPTGCRSAAEASNHHGHSLPAAAPDPLPPAPGGQLFDPDAMAVA